MLTALGAQESLGSRFWESCSGAPPIPSWELAASLLPHPTFEDPGRPLQCHPNAFVSPPCPLPFPPVICEPEPILCMPTAKGGQGRVGPQAPNSHGGSRISTVATLSVPRPFIVQNRLLRASWDHQHLPRDQNNMS